MEIVMSSIQRCQCCGQVIYGDIPDDPLADTVLHILDRSNGNYVPARVIADMVSMDVHYQTIWRRLHALELDGLVERHPDRPKSGWRKVRHKLDK